MTTIANQVQTLINLLSDKDMFLCENNLQARTMSDGFVQEAKIILGMVERLERDLLIEHRRYAEVMEHKNELAKEVQCARIYLENSKQA